MTEIHLVRHAHYEAIGRTLTGRMPGLHLSPAGKEAAAALARGWPFGRCDRIISSPLERCVETAGAFGGDVEIREELAEVEFGEWTGREIESLNGDPAWDVWNTRRSEARCPSGESMAEAQGRIMGLIREVAGSGGSLKLVTHCDLIRAAVCDVLGLSLDGILRIEVEALSVTSLRFSADDGMLQRLNFCVASGVGDARK